MHVEDFDQKKGEVTIRRTFSENVLMDRTKTKRPRTIPLEEPITILLSNLKKNILSGLFFRVHGKPYKLDRLNKVWAKAIQRAGLPHIKLKNGTRHSFICQKLNYGEPIKLVEEYVGHSAMKMTEVYTSVNVESF